MVSWINKLKESGLHVYQVTVLCHKLLEGTQSITVEITAPNIFDAEEDVTSMLHHGDGWTIIQVESVEIVEYDV